MPTENNIDCPALHKRSSSYPFGDRVPRTVRMLKTVTADPMPGIGLAYIKGKAPVANKGQSYPVWTNSHGAVTAVMEDGTRLGLRPAEFEVESWHHLAAEPAPQHPEPIAWMVGIAIWWTKEEAERDAAETGLPIVGLGPMTDSAEVERLREALKFYADRDHFAEDIGSDWDSVSGEPANVLWHESEAWFVEDGSIARDALERRPEKSRFNPPPLGLAPAAREHFRSPQLRQAPDRHLPIARTCCL
ncbi:hypothetical protein [Pseudomonas sp. zbq_11]|uniref:hypothetical protein n=1 Tax=unclassified Pseudomonas TaxID=196821 RepID=UPI00370A4B7C